MKSTGPRTVPQPDASLPDRPHATDLSDIDDVLEQLPEDQALEVRQAMIEFRSAHFSGPLPPAETFRAYNEILPGAADRILVMAEKEQGHRIAMQQGDLKAASLNSLIGQGLGFSPCWDSSAAAFSAFMPARRLAPACSWGRPCWAWSAGWSGTVGTTVRPTNRPRTEYGSVS